MEKILEYVVEKGWKHRVVKDEIQVEICPFCDKDNHHFSINKNSEKWHCFVCSEGGTSLRQLRYKLGDRIYGVVSISDSVKVKTADLPSVEKLHKDLFLDENSDALDYLVCDRGYTYDSIKELKLGVYKRYFAKPAKECKCIAIPYFKGTVPIYIKFRTIPPTEKDFVSTELNNIPCYNENILSSKLDELILTEGECDTISLLSAGYKNVVGIPGANNKNSSWFAAIEKCNPKKIYIAFDNDQVGQKSAKDLAIRFGFSDNIYNILLPKFKTVEGTEGKDINDFLRLGGGYEKFLELKENSKPFNIEGVQEVVEVIDELEEDFKTNDESFKPTLFTPWPTLNKLITGCEFGDLVGISGQSGIGKTTIALNWLDYYSRSEGLVSFLYCLEMPIKRMVRKWLTLITRVPEEEFTLDSFALSKEVIKNMKGNLIFGQTNFKKSDDIFETIWQVKRRYGVNVVCFDNLHIISRSIDNKSAEIDTLSKKFKQIAMELNILILLIIQPTKLRKEEIVSIYDSRGSAAIPQDLDFGIAIHRNPSVQITQKDFAMLGTVDTEISYQPQMLIDVGKSRYSSGGKGTLWFDGEISLVREISEVIGSTRIPDPTNNIII